MLGFALWWVLEKLHHRQAFSLRWILWCHTTVSTKKSTNHETVTGLCYILCSRNSLVSFVTQLKQTGKYTVCSLHVGRQKNTRSFTTGVVWLFFWLSGYFKQWYWLVTAGAAPAAWQIFQLTFPTESRQVECETHLNLRQLHSTYENTLSQPCTNAVQEHQ